MPIRETGFQRGDLRDRVASPQRYKPPIDAVRHQPAGTSEHFSQPTRPSCGSSP